jgi:hypothetical protein
MMPPSRTRERLRLWYLPTAAGQFGRVGEIAEGFESHLFEVAKGGQRESRVAEFERLVLIDSPEPFRVRWIVAQNPGEVI